MAGIVGRSGKRGNLKTPAKDQTFKNIRFDRPMWEALSVLSRQQSAQLMLNVSAADLVRKFCQAGLDRAAAENGRGTKS